MATNGHQKEGTNEWLIEEMRRRYQDSPQSVSSEWRSYFQQDPPPQDSQPTESSKLQTEQPKGHEQIAPSISPGEQPGDQQAATNTKTEAEPDTDPIPTPSWLPETLTEEALESGTSQVFGQALASDGKRTSLSASTTTSHTEFSHPDTTLDRLHSPETLETSGSREPPKSTEALAVPTSTELTGIIRTISQRMDQSLTIPTATSVRTIPTKLLEVNRLILNNQLRRRLFENKVSFTHLIAWAVAAALGARPELNVSYKLLEGKPHLIHHPHLNLGIAVDVQGLDGNRRLLVPNLKAVETMDFRTFWEKYTDLVTRARTGKLSLDELGGTTVTITNPGTIGTVSSVPRLMNDQGLIIGLGAITYPPEYQASDEQFLARQGIGRVMSITSTYDHRVIQGAQSGELLDQIHRLLLGEDRFYDQIFDSMEIPYTPARWAKDDNPPMGSREWVEKQAKVFQIIHAYRIRGHLIADLDPLRQTPPHMYPELDPLHYGLTIWDLDREFASGGVGGVEVLPLGTILSILRNVYCRTTGVEYMHIQDTEQLSWLQQRLESDKTEYTDTERLRIFDQLNRADAFERFLHTKFVGHKRFGLEGGESLIPLLDALADEAGNRGAEQAMLGMTHRGRLNVMANFTKKPLRLIFREFDGDYDISTTGGSGDVKYHLGYSGVYQTASGHSLAVSVAANPSHLEAIDPVLEGLARAAQDRLNVEERRPLGDPVATRKVVPVLLHGDAAFAGQGVVAETFNLSQLADYWTGGTIHIVINNQVGFTTPAVEARSSHYATDVAKAVQAPIIHVNGDDPEAVVRAARLAVEYRFRFSHDVVIDMVCYRLRGHNEGDEPSYTQPLMYRKIENHVPVRNSYLQRLSRVGLVEPEEVEEVSAGYRRELEEAFVASGQHVELSAQPSTPVTPMETPQHLPNSDTASVAPLTSAARRHLVDSETEDDGHLAWEDLDTSVSADRLHHLLERLTTMTEEFVLHPKLIKQTDARARSFANDAVDWATGELLAFASLAEEGIPVRLAGEDCRRGTFSQRHAELINYDTGDPRAPIEELGGAPVRIVDSLLSEFAAVGFEYGYSVGWPQALVLWEAQFGDFVNGAQVIIDQFLSAGQVKWGQESGLVLLLPHGQEGQGPEHSSARVERFLQLCAEENMRVVSPSNAGQYFHLLRCQALSRPRNPLVVLTPKSMLRATPAFASRTQLTSEGFQSVLDDPNPPDNTTRVVVCSGKVYFDLERNRRELEATNVALVRLELLYPFPDRELAEVVGRYPDAEGFWCQEEPENMGPYRFAREKLKSIFGGEVGYAGREAAASPAGGSFRRYRAQQEALVNQALGL